ncbi:RnfABCDGE type electron transport complex subunit D [Candidatus Micrarchaeota archaeon]|nr:RnfABCDGE type electron transport complex subunit D [Candidatus Micrarchaeota archaeon]
MFSEIYKKLPPAYDTMIICLVLIFLLNSVEQYSNSLDKVAILLLSSVGTALVVENLIFYFKNKRLLLISKSAIISGLIISLIIVGDMPMFNPAASGMLVALFLLSSPSEIWWGNTNMLAALLVGLVISWKIGKLNISISYLVAYTFFSILKIAFLGGQPLDSAVLTAISFFPMFSAFFMLTEPKTTPVRKETQIAFGCLVGLLFNVLEVISFPYSSFIALMIANLVRNRLDKLIPKPTIE